MMKIYSMDLVFGRRNGHRWGVGEYYAETAKKGVRFGLLEKRRARSRSRMWERSLLRRIRDLLRWLGGWLFGLQERSGSSLVVASSSINTVQLRVDLLIGTGNFLLQLHVVENTLVEDLLRGSARAQLVVLLLETLIVQLELLKAVLIYVVQYGNRTSRDSSSLLQTLDGASVVFVLTQHEIIVVWLTLGADEVGCTQKWSRSGTHLLNLRDILWQLVLVDILPVLVASKPLSNAHFCMYISI